MVPLCSWPHTFSTRKKWGKWDFYAKFRIAVRTYAGPGPCWLRWWSVTWGRDIDIMCIAAKTSNKPYTLPSLNQSCHFVVNSLIFHKKWWKKCVYLMKNGKIAQLSLPMPHRCGDYFTWKVVGDEHFRFLQIYCLKMLQFLFYFHPF